MDFLVEEGFVPLENGRYPAVLIAIEQQHMAYGDALKWIFSIKGHDREQWGWSGTKISPTTKPGQWASACLGRPLSVGESVNSANLIGAEVVLVISRYLDDDGTERNKIMDVNPAGAVTTDSAWADGLDEAGWAARVESCDTEAELNSLIPVAKKLQGELLEAVRQMIESRRIEITEDISW